MYKLHVKDSLWSGLENLPQLGLAALLLAPDSCSKAWVSEPRKVGVWCLHEASRARSPGRAMPCMFRSNGDQRWQCQAQAVQTSWSQGWTHWWLGAWGSVRAFLDPCLILPGPTTGDDWINLLTGNLDKSWRFVRICHRLPPNSCWLHAHSIIFFLLVESRLNPYGPIAGTRAAWHGETAAMSQVKQKLECPSSIRSLGKIIGIHRRRWSFNRLSSRQTFWISLIHFDSFIFYHMLSMVFPLALRSIFIIFCLCFTFVVTHFSKTFAGDSPLRHGFEGTVPLFLEAKATQVRRLDGSRFPSKMGLPPAAPEKSSELDHDLVHICRNNPGAVHIYICIIY